VPCSNLGLKEVTDFLKLKEFKYHVSTMYNTVSADLSDLADIKYDMIVFFSPQGPDSLFENFPDFVD
jgi:uroporphyrinogen-III synthase